MNRRLNSDEAWDRFMRTGRVEDYLACCKARDAASSGPAPAGREDGHADYYQGLDRERTAYR